MIGSARRNPPETHKARSGPKAFLLRLLRPFSSPSASGPEEEQEKIRTLIVGLGNPGKEYQETRHNVGFRVVELLAQRHGIELRRQRHQAVFGEGRIAGVSVLLAKPLTYMNLSGAAVAALARYHNVTPADILVICDDVALPVGRLRLRGQGSAGGHNGLRSIIDALGTTRFPRLRIGVGAPDGRPLVDHVLGRFDRAEAEAIAVTLAEAADAVETFLRDGLEAAMNRYNAGEPKREQPERKAPSQQHVAAEPPRERSSPG